VDLLDEFRASGLRLSTLAFSKAIAALGKGGRWRDACNLLGEISRRQLPHNALTTNLVLRACAEADQPVAAIEALLPLLPKPGQDQSAPADSETLKLAEALASQAEEGDDVNAQQLADLRNRLTWIRKRPKA